jgi:hypothetical protein
VVGNVNQAAREPGDKDPALVYRVDYSINEFAGVGFWGGHSFSKTDPAVPTQGRFDMFELDGYYTRGQLSLQGQVAMGRHESKAANGGDAQWWGLSGLVGYKLTPRAQVIARYDFINNSNNGGGMFGGAGMDGRSGFGPAYDLTDDGTGTMAWTQTDPNTGVNRYALSLGLNYLINPSTSLKAELRYDGANGNVFLQPDGSYKSGNMLFGTSVVVSF